MILRHLGVSLLALASVLSATAVQADGSDFPQCIVRDFERRQTWPRPFIYPDQESIYAPFDVQVCNGWRRQNTLAEYHFDQNGQLNEAGRLKVQWILNEAPQQHRAVFVYRGQSPQETAFRLNGVVQYASTLLGPGAMVPPVMETGTPAPSAPADRIDAIGRRFMKTMPEPKLPSDQGAGNDSQAK
jgi:hypothetical protein